MEIFPPPIPSPFPVIVFVPFFHYPEHNVCHQQSSAIEKCERKRDEKQRSRKGKERREEKLHECGIIYCWEMEEKQTSRTVGFVFIPLFSFK
jgi:hypothetical protein